MSKFDLGGSVPYAIIYQYSVYLATRVSGTMICAQKLPNQVARPWGRTYQHNSFELVASRAWIRFDPTLCKQDRPSAKVVMQYIAVASLLSRHSIKFVVEGWCHQTKRWGPT